MVSFMRVRSRGGRVLEVQRAQTPENERRVELVLPRAGWSVLRLRHPDVPHAIEESVDRDHGFGAREWRTRAGVDAVPERDVLARVGAADPKLRRRVEQARVSVGRA